MNLFVFTDLFTIDRVPAEIQIAAVYTAVLEVGKHQRIGVPFGVERSVQYGRNFVRVQSAALNVHALARLRPQNFNRVNRLLVCA